MKNIFYTLGALLFFSLASCVTGNDDSAVLREHNEQIARTPRVLDLTVDGTAPWRDEQSIWQDFVVNPGDQVIISATYNPGNGAASADFDFSRSYHHTAYDAADAKAVEPMTDRITTVSSETNFTVTYTVPTLDDEGEAFGHGDHINLTWWSSNNLGGQGFNDINLVYE